MVCHGILIGVVLTAAADPPGPSPPDVDRWWEAFGNETLNAVITQGLETHPDLSGAVAALSSARASRDRVASERSPQADARIGVRVGKERTMFTNRRTGDSEPFAGEAQLSWELDLFGRTRAALDAADSRTGVAQADIAGIRLMLSTEIARTYFELAASQERLRVAREIGAIRSRLEKRLETRVDKGLQAQPEHSAASARQQMSAHMVMQEETIRDKAVERLQALLGGVASTNAAPGLEHYRLPDYADTLAPTNAIARPDVLAAWWELQAADAVALSSGRARLPTIRLLARAAGEVADDGEAEPWHAWVGPVLELPLWRQDLGADADMRRADAATARAEFESVSLVAMREIGLAVVERENVEAMIGHMRDRREDLDRITSSMQRRREAGLMQESEMLDSLLKGLEARLDEIDWQLAGLLSHVNLVRAQGGGT